MSPGSSVGTATGYRLDDRGVGVRVPVVPKIFMSSMSSMLALGSTQPPIQGVPGGSILEGRTDHSPVVVLSYIRLHGVVLIWSSSGATLHFNLVLNSVLRSRKLLMLESCSVYQKFSLLKYQT
jgi:hypothetical protein